MRLPLNYYYDLPITIIQVLKAKAFVLYYEVATDGMQRETDNSWYIIFCFCQTRRGSKGKGLRRGHYLRIDSSMLGMESARRFTSSTTRSSRFLVKDYSRGTANGMKNDFGNLLNPGSGDELSGMEENAQKDLSMTKDSITDLRERVESFRNTRLEFRNSTASALESFKESTIRSIFSMLFGGSRANRFLGGSGNDFSYMETGGGQMLTMSTEMLYQESESTSFSTKGTVRTADGREISIDVDVTMSRRFTRYFQEELQIMQVNTCDPLVLNFDGNAAELTNQKFLFDIDGDGEEDEISMLGSGSGYLALDKNEDGIINSGKELFGPDTGNGFSSLEAYDEDGNGWIDENDSIWSKLKIWSKNPDGTDTLYTLAEKGVGAICLQNARTDFALNNADNQTNGLIRSTGIFLYENGNVGTVQHVDVAK